MTTSVTVPNTAGTNPLKGLLEFGQSPWMDYIRRDLLTGGGLKKMIDADGLRGMTSNPSIFEKSITGSTLYNDILQSPEAKSSGRKEPLRKDRHPRRAGRLRYFQACIPIHAAPRRLRQPGGLALSRERHEGHDGRSAPPLENGRSRKPDGQGSWHA